MSIPCEKLVNFYTKTFTTIYSFKRDSIYGKIKFLCKSAILCLDPININSVFKTFKVSLFAISQFWRNCKSIFMSCCSSGMLQAVKVILVSSAYILTVA